MAGENSTQYETTGSIATEQHWLLRDRQKRLLAYSTCIALLLLLLGLVANLVPDNEIAEALRNFPTETTLLLLTLVAVPAAGWLWIGMSWFWLRFDTSTRNRKIFWFLVLLLLNWVGAIPYYFFVYRKIQPGPPDVARTLRAFPIFLTCLFFASIPLLYFYPRLATSKLTSMTLFLTGLFIVIPTIVALFVRLCRYGLRTASSKKAD